MRRLTSPSFADPEEIKSLGSIGKELTFFAIGFGGLVFGADLALQGAVKLGQIAGLSERIIGITIVSVGTGLPELVTSMVAAYRGRNDIAVANVVGSITAMVQVHILFVTSIPSPAP